MFKGLKDVVAGLGHGMIDGIWRIGAGARLFSYIGIGFYLLESFKRPRLIVREIFSTGVL